MLLSECNGNINNVLFNKSNSLIYWGNPEKPEYLYNNGLFTEY